MKKYKIKIEKRGDSYVFELMCKRSFKYLSRGIFESSFYSSKEKILLYVSLPVAIPMLYIMSLFFFSEYKKECYTWVDVKQATSDAYCKM